MIVSRLILVGHLVSCLVLTPCFVSQDKFTVDSERYKVLSPLLDPDRVVVLKRHVSGISGDGGPDCYSDSHVVDVANELRRLGIAVSSTSLLTAYSVAVILPAFDCTLHEVLHYRTLSVEERREVGRGVARAIHHLQEMGLVHGDVNPRNICYNGKSVKLHNLSTAAWIGVEHFGSLSTATGFFPPERLCQLSLAQLGTWLSYWTAIHENDRSALIHPEAGEYLRDPSRLSSGTIVTRSYFEDRTHADQSSRRAVHDPDNLPYSVLLVHESHDVWSLGALLYQLYSVNNITLFPTDKYYDLVSLEDKQKLLYWSDGLSDLRVSENVTDPLAAHLIRSLLKAKPYARLTPSQVLSHPFIRHDTMSDARDGDRDSTPDSSGVAIEEGENKVRGFIRRLATVMKSCEVIDSEAQERIQRAHVGLFRGWGGRRSDEDLAVMIPSSVTITRKVLPDHGPEVPTTAGISSTDEWTRQSAVTWLDTLASIFSLILSVEPLEDEDISKEIHRLLDQGRDGSAGESKLFLYLMDEYSGLPVVPASRADFFPLAIDVTSELASALFTLFLVRPPLLCRLYTCLFYRSPSLSLILLPSFRLA